MLPGYLSVVRTPLGKLNVNAAATYLFVVVGTLAAVLSISDGTVRTMLLVMLVAGTAAVGLIALLRRGRGRRFSKEEINKKSRDVIDGVKNTAVIFSSDVKWLEQCMPQIHIAIQRGVDIYVIYDPPGINPDKAKRTRELVERLKRERVFVIAAREEHRLRATLVDYDDPDDAHVSVFGKSSTGDPPYSFETYGVADHRVLVNVFTVAFKGYLTTNKESGPTTIAVPYPPGKSEKLPKSDKLSADSLDRLTAGLKELLLTPKAKFFSVPGVFVDQEALGIKSGQLYFFIKDLNPPQDVTPEELKLPLLTSLLVDSSIIKVNRDGTDYYCASVKDWERGLGTSPKVAQLPVASADDAG